MDKPLVQQCSRSKTVGLVGMKAGLGAVGDGGFGDKGRAASGNQVGRGHRQADKAGLVPGNA